MLRKTMTGVKQKELTSEQKFLKEIIFYDDGYMFDITKIESLLMHLKTPEKFHTFFTKELPLYSKQQIFLAKKGSSKIRAIAVLSTILLLAYEATVSNYKITTPFFNKKDVEKLFQNLIYRYNVPRYSLSKVYDHQYRASAEDALFQKAFHVKELYLLSDFEKKEYKKTLGIDPDDVRKNGTIEIQQFNQIVLMLKSFLFKNSR